MTRGKTSQESSRIRRASRRFLLRCLAGCVITILLTKTLRIHSWVDGMSASIAGDRIALWERAHVLLGAILAPILASSGYVRLAQIVLKTRNRRRDLLPFWISTAVLVGTLFLAVGILVSTPFERPIESILHLAPFFLIGIVCLSVGITVALIRTSVTLDVSENGKQSSDSHTEGM